MAHTLRASTPGKAEALFRYSLIRELADPELSPRKRGVMICTLAELEHARDAGRRVRVSPATLRRWLRHWRAGGFQALLPGLKLQPKRTPAEILEAAFNFKRETPGRTAVQVGRILAEAGAGKVSSRTLQRQFARAGLNVRPDGYGPARLRALRGHRFRRALDRRRPARVGGGRSHGDPVRLHRRLQPGGSGLAVGPRRGHRPPGGGLESAGVPRAVFVDHGSAFVSAPSTAPWPRSASASSTPGLATRLRAGRLSASSPPCVASSWSS
jgi:putative transposase